MNAGTIWVHPTAAAVSGVAEAIARLPGTSARWEAPPEPPPHRPCVALTHYDALSAEERHALERTAKRGVTWVLLSRGPGRAELAQLFTAGVLSHLLPLEEGAVAPARLELTLRRLMGQNPTDLAAYFTESVEPVAV